MDHQVQDHADFGATGIELRVSVDVNKERGERKVFYSQEGGVETFDMANLEFNSRFTGKLDQLVSFFHGVGQGLFDKDMFAFLDSFLTPLKVKRGRSDHI